MPGKSCGHKRFVDVVSILIFNNSNKPFVPIKFVFINHINDLSKTEVGSKLLCSPSKGLLLTNFRTVNMRKSYFLQLPQIEHFNGIAIFYCYHFCREKTRYWAAVMAFASNHTQ